MQFVLNCFICLSGTDKRTLTFPPTYSKLLSCITNLVHSLLLCTNTLASLVKGEVLSPEKILATTGGIAFLPHPFRFSDTSANNPSIVGSASYCNRSSPLHKGAKGDSALPTLPKPHYPSKIAITLASLVKGRWIDGKEQALILLLSICDTSAFFIHQTFLPSRRRDCSPSAPSIRFSALSLSLFVGRGACPSRCIVVIDFLSVFNLLSIED